MIDDLTINQTNEFDHLQVRIIVAVVYAVLTPFLNPLIYSLRNKELQEAIRRTLLGFRPAAGSATKNINTES